MLCDIRMPGESGIDLLTELTADFPDVAVVMTTGVDDPHIADVAFGIGAFGYMVKPFDTNELLISLASALHRRDLESAQRGQCARSSRRSPARGSSAASSRGSSARARVGQRRRGDDRAAARAPCRSATRRPVGTSSG